MPVSDANSATTSNLGPFFGWESVEMSKPVCPDCGQTLPAGSPDDACPACLFSLGLAATPPRDDDALSPVTAAPGDRIGRYRLLQPLEE